MKRIYRAVALLAVLLGGPLWSACSAAVLLPQQNFLVVTSSQDSLADYYDRFGTGLISTAAFRELVVAMNPSAGLQATTIAEPLMADLILTLPGQQTLKPFTALSLSNNATEALSEDASALTIGPQVDVPMGTNTDTASARASRPRGPAPSRIRQHQRVPSSHTYTVKYGDNLFRISLRHGMDMLALAALNNLQAPYDLIAGQTLLINAATEPAMSEERGIEPRNKARERIENDDAIKPHAGDYKLTVAKADRGSYPLSQPAAVPTYPVSSHLDHSHELLLPSAFVMFCMREANAITLLTELRQNFDGMLSSDIGDQGYIPVTEYLKDQGYLRARVESDSDGRASYVRSGPRYQVVSLEIVPRQSEADRREQHPQMSLPVNQFYSPQLEQQLSTAAIEWLAEQGYPLADVSDMQWQFDDPQHQVNFHLRYDASRAVQITEVDHSGVNALSPRQLRKLSPFTDSESYSQSALDQFRSRLMATGYYENVSFELLVDDATEAGEHRLEVNTTSAKRNRIQALLGYAPGRNLVLDAALKLPNITGNEDDVSLKARADSFSQQVNLAYQRRNLFWYGADFGLSTGVARQDQPYFFSDLVTIDLLGAWHGEDRQDGSNWHVSFGWSSADERRVDMVENQRFEYGRLGAGWSGRGRGVFEFARDWSVNLAHAFSLNPETDNYWSLSATTDWVVSAPFDRHFDLRLGADIRYADNIEAIPLSAQLFHGGEFINRGYESASFSSLDLDAESSVYQVYAQLEMPWDANFRTPWLTRLIPFLDFSVMGADGGDDAQGFSSIGLGFAGAVAGYPYRADVAVPLDGQAGDGLLVSFNVGLQ